MTYLFFVGILMFFSLAFEGAPYYYWNRAFAQISLNEKVSDKFFGFFFWASLLLIAVGAFDFLGRTFYACN